MFLPLIGWRFRTLWYWNGNAETDYLISDAMGKAMLVHLGQPKKQALSTRSGEQLLLQFREAYTLLDRIELSKALAAKGVAAIPQLSTALNNEHWHVRNSTGRCQSGYCRHTACL